MDAIKLIIIQLGIDVYGKIKASLTTYFIFCVKIIQVRNEST